VVGRLDGVMEREARGRHPRWRTWLHGRVFPRWSGAADDGEKKVGKGEERHGEVAADRRVPLVGDSRKVKEKQAVWPAWLTGRQGLGLRAQYRFMVFPINLYP
jgi:hypothetical protein